MASPLGCLLGAEAQHDADFRAHGIYFGHQNDGLLDGFWFIANDRRYPLQAGGDTGNYTDFGNILVDMANHCSCSLSTFAIKATGLCGHY